MHLPLARRQPEHVVAFYQADNFLVEEVASFVADGLSRGEQLIVVATANHWNAIAERLENGAVAYRRGTNEGRLVFVEADQILDSVTVDGHVSVERFRAMLEPLIKSGSRTRIYGELVSLLVQRGDVDGAIAIERVGQELSQTVNVNVLCGYHIDPLRPLSTADMARIAEVHDRSYGEYERAVSPAASRQSQHGQFHAVRFYEDRESLAGIAGQFLGEGFAAGSPAIVIATPQHCEAIKTALSHRFFDVARLQAVGDLLFTDAQETLSRFMVRGMPDAGRFRAAIVPLIEQACRGRKDCLVRAYGEMVDVLWKGGKTVAAVRLETLWNQLARSESFALLCGYSMGHFYKDAAHQEVCGVHTHVVSEDGSSVVH